MRKVLSRVGCLIISCVLVGGLFLPIAPFPAAAMTAGDVKLKEDLEKKVFDYLKELAEQGIETESLKKALTTLCDKAADINKVATAYAEAQGWYAIGNKEKGNDILLGAIADVLTDMIPYTKAVKTAKGVADAIIDWGVTTAIDGMFEKLFKEGAAAHGHPAYKNSPEHYHKLRKYAVKAVENKQIYDEWLAKGKRWDVPFAYKYPLDPGTGEIISYVPISWYNPYETPLPFRSMAKWLVDRKGEPNVHQATVRLLQRFEETNRFYKSIMVPLSQQLTTQEAEQGQKKTSDDTKEDTKDKTKLPDPDDPKDPPGNDHPDDNFSVSSGVIRQKNLFNAYMRLGLKKDIPEVYGWVFYYECLPEARKDAFLNTWNAENIYLTRKAFLLNKDRIPEIVGAISQQSIEESNKFGVNLTVDGREIRLAPYGLEGLTENPHLISASFEQMISLLDSINSAPDVAMLHHGFHKEAAALLSTFNEPVALLDVNTDIQTLKQYPVLIIPTGGLYGLASSPSFRAKLEQYVANGGRLIVFSQQRGSDYAALPGGEVRGYGWFEDQSCQYASVDITSYHVILCGQSSTRPSINVDGYFTRWAKNATILLTRSKNGMPAKLMYRYGQGWVIVSSSYDDWAYAHYAATKDGMKLIRDTISWAKQPEAIPEYAPRSQIHFSIEVRNHANSPANSVAFYLIDPDRNIADQTQVNFTEPLLPGESRVINFSYSHSALGIWFVDYSLSGSGVIQNSYEVARFAISRYAENPNGFTYQGAETTFTITTLGEDFPYGSDVPFTIHIYNHGNTSRTISFNTYYKDWSLSPKLWEQNIAGNLTVPPKGEASFTGRVHVGDIYLSHNQLIIYASFSEDGTSLGYTRRAVNMFHPSIGVNVTTDKQAYALGGNVSLLLTLQNRRGTAYSVITNIRVLDPENTIVFHQSIEITLNANATRNQTLSFSLLTPAAYGVYLIIAEAYVAGNRAGSGSTYFEVVKDYLVKVTFDRPNNVYKARDNMTLVLNVTNVGVTPWSSMINTSIPAVGLQRSEDFTLEPSQSTSVSYNLTIPGNITAGKHDVIITIQMDNSTKKYYFFTPESRLTLSIDRTSYKPGENVTISLANIGGVDTTYSYFAKLFDPHRTVIYEGRSDDSIQAGESKTLQFTIPEQAVTGNYRLWARCNDLSTGKATLLSKSLTISALSASLEVSTDKQIYLANETINASTHIINTGDAVENATLSLKVYSGRYQVAPEVSIDDSLDNRLRIYNDFIEAVVRISGEYAGRFTAATTGGDPAIPSDDNANLMYGHPLPWSSFTTVRIDGNDYIYGSANGSFVLPPHFENSSMVSSWKVADIVVTQSLTIVYSATGHPDALRIGYSVKNEGNLAKDVGIRVMIDTQLRDEDGAPFVIPNIGNVTREMEFSGLDVPVWWTTMDSLTAPAVIAHGTLRGVGSDPDKFVIAEWGSIEETLWDYAIDPSREITGDSAIGIWWNPVSVPPGGSREVATFYGIGYVSAVGPVVIWEHEQPLSLAEGDEIVKVMNITGLNATGKLALVSTLSSTTSQIIAEDMTYFYIAVGDVYLTLETDKTIYKPNEEIIISGNVTNGKDEPWNYTLTIKVNAEEIYSQSFNLTAGESRSFYTTTAQESSFILEGTVNGVTITDFIRIEYPVVDVTILAPDVAGFAPFDVGILLENIGNVDANINVIMRNESWNITVPAGQSQLIEVAINITEDTTLEAVISGDISRTVRKRIAFGENARVNITPRPTYLEGAVEIPFTIQNVGLLDTQFRATFSIDNQTIQKSFFVPEGQSIADSVSFNLTKGVWWLKYVSPFEEKLFRISVLSPEFVVTSILPADMNFTMGQNVTFIFKVRNLGGAEGEATIRLSMPDFEETNSARIRAGEEEDISFNFTIPDDLEEKSYKGIYELDGKREEFPFFVQGAKITVDASLDKALYKGNETAVLTLNVTNNRGMALSLFSRVKFNEYDEVQWFNLTGWGSKSVSFHIPVKFAGENKALYTVYMSSGRALYINSIYIYEEKLGVPITLTTDKQVYEIGERAVLFFNATEPGSLVVRALGQEISMQIREGATIVELDIPRKLRSGTYYIEYTFNEKTYLYPIDVRGYSARVIEFSLDKPEYVSGEKLKMSMTVEINRATSGVLRFWLYDSLDNLIDSFDKGVNFGRGENKFDIERELRTERQGIHSIVYRVYAKMSDLISLASGVEYFDVTYAALVADFTVDKTEAAVGEVIFFIDESSGGPTSWLWEFGDGETSTLPNPSHAYSTPGTYTVKLAVKNPAGSDTEIKTNLITVYEPRRPPAPAPPAIPRARYVLTINRTEGGSVTKPGEGSFTYSTGTVVALAATPHAGYRFVKWIGDVGTIGNVTAASTTITINDNYSIRANFVPVYRLTIMTTAGGTVATPGVGTFSHDGGTVVSLVATPVAGYRFVNWTGDVGTIGNVTAASTTITMNGNYSITANFVKQYNLTISSMAGGNVTTPGEGRFRYDTAAVVNLTAKPDKGYRFVKWTGDVVSIADVTAATTTITMNGDYSITANFEVEARVSWALIVGIVAAAVVVGLAICFPRWRRRAA